MEKLSFKVMSVFLALAIAAMGSLVVAVPAQAQEPPAAQVQEEERWECEVGYIDNVLTLSYLDGAEIEIIDGLPYIVVEKEDGYIHIPLLLTDTMDMMVEGVPVTVEVDGNYLLIRQKMKLRGFASVSLM